MGPANTGDVCLAGEHTTQASHSVLKIYQQESLHSNILQEKADSFCCLDSEYCFTQYLNWQVPATWIYKKKRTLQAALGLIKVSSYAVPCSQFCHVPTTSTLADPHKQTHQIVTAPHSLGCNQVQEYSWLLF